MCFHLTASLTSPVFRFSFPLQTMLTWGKRLVHTLFHMFLSFLITVLKWLKSSQGGSQTAVLFCILQTTQPFPSLPIKIGPRAVDWLLSFAVVCSIFLMFLKKKDLGELPPSVFPFKWGHRSIAIAGVRISHCQVPIFHCEMPLTPTFSWGLEVEFHLHHPTASCHWPASSCCDPVPCPHCGTWGANEVMEFEADPCYLE